MYHHQQGATKRRVKLQKVASLRRYDFTLAFLAEKGKFELSLLLRRIVGIVYLMVKLMTRKK